MEARKLSNADLEKLTPWADKMVERFAGDYEAKDVLKMLQEKYEEHSTKPVFKNRDKIFLLNRAKSTVVTELTGMGNLEKMSAILIGPQGQSRDWNEDAVEEVQDKAKKGGRKEVFDMAEKGIIAAVEVAVEDKGGIRKMKKPVRKLLAPMVKGQDKKWAVRKWLDKEETKPAYELWEDGDPVIPLDTEKFLSDGKTDNWNCGNILSPNWAVTIMALVWREGEAAPIMAQFQVYGEPADPHNKEYIVDKITHQNLWLKPVVLKAEINDAKSKDGKLFLKTGKGGKYAIKPAAVTDFDLYNFLNEGAIIGTPEYTGDPHDGAALEMNPVKITVEGKKKEITPIVPIVDLENIREYHEKLQMMTNKSGELKKNYGAIALMEATIMATKDPEEGSSIVVSVKDNSLVKGRYSAFLPRFMRQLPFAEAADVLMFITTGKRDDYYDTDLRQRVKDDDGKKGEISINVLNMLVLMEHEIEEEEESQEDAANKKDDNKEVEV